MLLAGALSDAYLEIHDNPAGVGQGRYYFTEYDPATGQDTYASAETIIFGPGGGDDDPDTGGGGGGGGGGGSTPEPPSMTTEYIHADHLGSTRLVTDEMGLEIARYKYYPFGHYAETSSGSDVRMKFTGHERDESLGLDYMLARYYAPGLGAFLGVDPAINHETDPQSWNRYSYVSNAPTVFNDPTGLVQCVATYVTRKDGSRQEVISQATAQAIYDAGIQILKESGPTGEKLVEKINALTGTDGEPTFEIRTNDTSHYDRRNNLIVFNPLLGVEITPRQGKPDSAGNYIIAPILILGHELIHAILQNTYPSKNNHPHIIPNLEVPLARDLDQPQRNRHAGTPVRVAGGLEGKTKTGDMMFTQPGDDPHRLVRGTVSGYGFHSQTDK